jgi:transmembrane sensor
MNNFSHPTARSATTTEEQASLWAARLEGGTLGATDRIALDAWLATNPTHRALLSNYCQFSADLEQLLPSLVSSGAIQMPVAAQSAHRRWKFPWLTLAGGSLAAAAGLAVFITLSPNAPAVETLATSVAQHQSFTLSDGTRVELNAQTSVRVENTRNERRVRLASGEAYFAVAKDPSRPFIVETPTGSVRVTGTIFAVRTDKNSELEVTVVEGSVQVRPSDTGGAGPVPPSALTAGEHISAVAGVVTRRKLTESGIEDALAWRQGKVVFNNVPLRSALRRFAQYHGKGLTATVGAENLSIGAHYALADLERFLDDVQQIHPVRVNREPSGLIRVSLRTEP